MAAAWCCSLGYSCADSGLAQQITTLRYRAELAIDGLTASLLGLPQSLWPCGPLSGISISQSIGEQRVTLTLPYHPETLTPLLDEALLPRLWLLLYCYPETLDGRPLPAVWWSQTRVTRFSASQGSDNHRLILQGAGWCPGGGRVTLTAADLISDSDDGSGTRTLSLIPARANLTPGTLILLGGERLGVERVAVEISPGSHSVRVTARALATATPFSFPWST